MGNAQSSTHWRLNNPKKTVNGTVYSHGEGCKKKDKASLFYALHLLEIVPVQSNHYTVGQKGGRLQSGTHETQVSEGGEADLHKHFNTCTKNPGHKRFVPVNDFNVYHLPQGYQDNDLVELIKVTSFLTVRVTVKMTSTERPAFWPNTTAPYAFYNMKGKDVVRVGTGTLWCANEEYNEGMCPCYKCQHSDTPNNMWGEVRMCTATHVVFDDLEARHTTCRLFYDGQDSPLVTLDGWTMCDANIEEDSCVLTCVTCDVGLLDTLEMMRMYWFDLWKKLHHQHKSSRDKDKLSFIVSHPHGGPKQISVGQWITRYELSCSWTKYTYTTCTCPGSSGAYVHIMGYENGRVIYCDHVHSGVNSLGINFCSIGLDLL